MPTLNMYDHGNFENITQSFKITYFVPFMTQVFMFHDLKKIIICNRLISHSIITFG